MKIVAKNIKKKIRMIPQIKKNNYIPIKLIKVKILTRI